MNMTLEWLKKNMIGPLNESEDSEIKQICSITSKIPTIYLWILFAIGFPANIFTIITTLTMQVMSPATFFVALLATFDGTALVAKLIFQQVMYHKVPIGDFGCKSEFILTYLATVANWMLVLICVERFVSVLYPLKKISWITKRRSYISAAAVSIFILILYGSISIPMRISRIYICGTKQEHAHFWKNYWYWINATFFLFLPVLLIVISTVGIIRGLHISRRDRRILLEKGSGRDGGSENAERNNQRLVAESERVERAITIMMILAALLFIALALPACLYHLLGNNKTEANCSSSLSAAHWDMFKQIQHILVDATHAINFFIYFISAKRFRDQLFKLLRCKCRKKQKFHNKYQNTYSTQLSTSSKIHNSVVPQIPIK